MMWQRNIQYPNIIYAIYFVGFGSFICAFLLQYTSLFSAGVCLVILAWLPKVYLKYISKRLMLFNDRQKIRLMLGENGQLHFSLGNEAKLPVLFAQCRVVLDDAVTIGETEGEKRNTYTRNFSLGPRQKVTFTVPVSAKKRGFVKVRTLEVTIKDPFNLTYATLLFNRLVKKEVVVYPKPLAVSGLSNIVLMAEGKLPNTSSIYTDHAAPIGTRDYAFNDPFKHIHWKASARTGQLQTKMFEQVIGMTWTIILLIEPGYHHHITMVEFERSLSAAAYIAQFAEKRGITYDVFVNIKTKGSGATISMPADTGIRQLIKTWELFSFINLSHIRTKVRGALSDIDKAMTDRRVIMMLHIGRDRSDAFFYNKWLKKGHIIYTVGMDDDRAMLTPLAGRGGAVAK
ncbi:uncharacterized protein (DUF58 family) [Scopulibacillus darangshiensis]|uniref:Uncharacterized protein (DUF58 family) n=1 Tax=Scopulibacillus darangshiensis TaxID=442528 RepID=A0A4R2P9S9_9BACL|nr:DUF58 domain-containing protein [Scopulibacillus darangshiensis]TCP31793.1 uncharacterized protein (DUF58 family) [Scopulibacillus darangshiensis]